jgi:hypothetical protein
MYGNNPYGYMGAMPNAVPQYPNNSNMYTDRLSQMMNQPQPKPVAAPSVNVDWVQVNGFEGAKAQQVQMGSVCWMRDVSEPFIYVKAVDQFGTPNTEMFRVEKVDPAQLNKPAQTFPSGELDFLDIITIASAIVGVLNYAENVDQTTMQNAVQGAADDLNAHLHEQDVKLNTIMEHLGINKEETNLETD